MIDTKRIKQRVNNPELSKILQASHSAAINTAMDFADDLRKLITENEIKDAIILRLKKQRNGKGGGFRNDVSRASGNGDSCP